MSRNGHARGLTPDRSAGDLAGRHQLEAGCPRGASAIVRFGPVRGLTPDVAEGGVA